MHARSLVATVVRGRAVELDVANALCFTRAGTVIAERFCALAMLLLA